MSQAKKDRVSHLSETRKIEVALIKGVVQNLRKIGGANTSAVKRIARETGINPRTVKAWYEGQNIPNLCAFIHLARCYPGLIDLFLDQCQRRPDRQRKGAAKNDIWPTHPTHTPVSDDKNSPENVPNDVPNRIDTSSCNNSSYRYIS